MNIVTPKVFLVADSKFTAPLEYLESLGCLDFTHQFDPEDDQANLSMFGGKLCYKAFKPGINPNVTQVRTDLYDYIKNIHKVGHGSVIEHGCATFLFQHVSRVYTHELVRHRVGTAFSQESLRFVRLSDLDIWKPHIFKSNPRADEIFNAAVKYLEMVQKELAQEFDLDNPELNFNRKKFITSHMRRLAPIGLATSILVTMNMRALRHLIQQRTSRHAEEEIRLVFNQVALICKDSYPAMFQDFYYEDIEGYGQWRSPFASMPYDQEKLDEKDKHIKKLEQQIIDLQQEVEDIHITDTELDEK